MDYHEILYRYPDGPQRMNPTDFGNPLTFPLAPPWGSHGLEWNVSTTIGWIGMNLIDIHVPLRMKYNNICNTLNFHLALVTTLAPASDIFGIGVH